MNNKIKYFLYARKSSESEDRQVASIESQKDVLIKLAAKEDLEIIDILTEAQSAKAPGRPIFNQMIERVSKGEAQGIICWKLDRLARNPIDGAIISWMLQQGQIQHIQTYEKNYYPNDNVLMMTLEFGMANQYIRDLSSNVKRGLLKKAQEGCYPRSAPIGYLNNPITKADQRIIKDPQRFDLVKKMFELMLTNKYSPPKILAIATKEWGLRNRNNKPMSRSNIYRLFTDPFYYGEFEFPKGSGNWYQGRYEPMISKNEYNQIQLLLKNKGRPKPKSHNFAYTGLIRCGECGAMITAEEKTKIQKNGNVHHYIYYHCTKRKGPCSQKGIEEKDLEKQILNILGQITIPSQFKDWLITELKKANEQEIQNRNRILENQKKAYETCIKKLDNLLDMRTNNEITEEEYATKKSALLTEKRRLQELLNDNDKRINVWLENIENLFNLATNAQKKFTIGTLEEKKQILMALGSNLLLKDRKLSIIKPKPLILVEKAAPEVNKLTQQVRTSKNSILERNLDTLYAQSPLVQGRQGLNLRPAVLETAALPTELRP